MLRAIQEIKPKFVIAENVFGITNIDGGLVFEQVCLDLETEGYEVQPFVIPAAAKNAPHRRDRVWFIAYNHSIIWGEGGQLESREQSRHRESNEKSNTKVIAKNTMFSGRLHREFEQEGTEVWQQRNTCAGSSKRIYLSERNAIDTKRIGRVEIRNDNGKFEKAQQEKRREQQFSRTDSAQSWWRQFPTQSPICGGDDGLPSQLDGITFSKWRAESIKGYGNAIVPQVALELFKIIETI